VIELRPIQERAISRVRDQLSAGKRRVLLCSPTGFGKTVVGAEMVRRFCGTGRRALWLTHREELLTQSAKAIRAREVSCGVIAASEARTTEEDLLKPCQVASLDTLVARNVRPRADLIVFDECHHAAALTYDALLADYPDAIIVGLTATPERGDGKGLGSNFDALVIGSTIRELVDLGYLVPLRVLRPKAPLRSGTIAQDVVDAYREHAPGTLAIVFSPSVELAQKHAADLDAAGVPARCIHGDMPSIERKLYIEAFRAGTIRVLTNCAVLTEGFDAPETSTIILARGCSTTGTFDQIVGRGVRAAPGKTGALLIDLRGVSHLHGMPIDGREYSLTGVGVSKPGAAPDSYCKVCGQILDVPGTPCPDCGHVAEPKTLRVAREELKPYDWITPFRARPVEERYKTLLNWVRLARAKGYKPGWVFGRYKAVFGVPVPREDLRRAQSEASR
jgi:superfamily II DNA or RNA helicase